MKKQFLFLSSVLSLLLATSSISSLNAAEPGNPASDHHKHKAIQYAGFYTTEDCKIAPEHPIIFDKEMVSPTKGIEHPCNSGDFIIKEPGMYRIIYSVSLEDECEGKSMWKKEYWKNVALTLNDHVILGSKMNIGEEGQLSTLAVLVKICDKTCCNNVIRVINNNLVSKGWHNIKLKAGEYCEDVTASIVIERIADCHHDCCCERK
ncbi:MAG: hypothetical protein V4489_10200 [Chlamydiota bacterium]